MSNPEFRAFVGPMFGSKTTKMLAAADRYRRQNRKVVAFKPGIDNRYSESEIVTHSGGKLPAHVVSKGEDILEVLESKEYDIIIVDEAFMVEGVADVLIKLFRQGKSIMITSLDLYHFDKTFSETEKMLPWATYIEKCPAICSAPSCNLDAYYTYKKVDTGKEREVGGAELYDARCMKHHPLIKLQ